MLAGLLLNEPVGGFSKKKRLRPKFIKNRYVQCEGYTIDVQDKPEKRIVRHVVKAVRGLSLGREQAKDAEVLVKQVANLSAANDTAPCDLVAWKQLIEILRANIAQLEEEEFLLLLMEL